jgi:hypothetical protein
MHCLKKDFCFENFRFELNIYEVNLIFVTNAQLVSKNLKMASKELRATNMLSPLMVGEKQVK